MVSRTTKFLAFLLLSFFSFAAYAAPFVYVANRGPNADPASDTVSVIDVATNAVVGSPITVGDFPNGIAVTPDGQRVLVTIRGASSGAVVMIDTNTNMVVGSPIPTDGPVLNGIAIAPNGQRAYVANSINNSVSVIDIQSNMVIGTPIPVGTTPDGIAVSPDGTRVYVANGGSDNVSAIDTATNMVIGSPIAVGDDPRAIVFTPDGSRAYVVNVGSDNVSVINAATVMPIGSPIPVGDAPLFLAITPDGNFVYVSNAVGNNVSVIRTSDNTVVPRQLLPVPYRAVLPLRRMARGYMSQTSAVTTSPLSTRQPTPLSVRRLPWETPRARSPSRQRKRRPACCSSIRRRTPLARPLAPKPSPLPAQAVVRVRWRSILRLPMGWQLRVRITPLRAGR